MIQHPGAPNRALQFPVFLLRGEHAPRPTRIIAEALSQLLPDNRLAVIDGAGHMGPLTHASEVSRLIVQHIAAANWRAGRRPTPLWMVERSSRTLG